MNYRIRRVFGVVNAGIIGGTSLALMLADGASANAPLVSPETKVSQAALTPADTTDTTASTQATAKATIDDAALALLKKTDATMRGLKTYQAELWKSGSLDSGTGDKVTHYWGTLTVARPNLLRHDLWETAADPVTAKARRTAPTPIMTIVYDGASSWQQWREEYMVHKMPEPPLVEPFIAGFYSAKSGLYEAATGDTARQLLEARIEGTETVGDTPCDRVFVHTRRSVRDSTIDEKHTYFIGKADSLLHRHVYETTSETTSQSSTGNTTGDTTEDTGGAKRMTSKGDSMLLKLVTNAPIVNPKKVFAYVAPKGVSKPKPYVSPPLLPNGTVAADFTAIDTSGKSVKLSDFRGKVVILDFWASWCPPCVASMPHNQAVAKKLQSENLPVVLLAVDNSEAREPFLKWVNAHEELDALTFVHADPKAVKIVDTLYKVPGIPTQYIIGAKGIIRASSIGFNGATDVLEKSVRRALAEK